MLIRADLASTLFVCCFFGSTIGIVSGLAAESTLAGVIPGILTLLGAVAAYLFGINDSKGCIVLLSIFSFLFGFLICLPWGYRVAIDRKDFEFCRAALSSPELLGNEDKQLAFFETFGVYCKDLVGRYSHS
jgi:hypothetical protein